MGFLDKDGLLYFFNKFKTYLIDDTAGDGDTDKTWSADKLTEELDQMLDSGTVPNAEQLLSDVFTTDTDPYTLRATSGKSDRVYEDAIVGGTVVWNQLIKNWNFADGTTGWGGQNGSIAVSNNKLTYTANGVTSSSGVYQQYVFTNCSNHVCIISFYLTPSVSIDIQPTKGNIKTISANTKNELNFIVKYGTITNDIFGIYFNKNNKLSDGDTVIVENVKIHDLTQMFGSTIADYIYSLEQATAGAGVAWFRKYFPNDYYPYNAGELISVSGVSEKDVVGFNLWDEEWEVGDINISTGQNTSGTSNTRAKGYIPVVPNAEYCFHTGRERVSQIFWYDVNKAFISNVANSTNNAVVSSPSNACYLRFQTPAAYGTTYNHDICINLSDPTRNGQYEPYTKRAYPLDSTLTLRGIPKLVDGKLSYDGDEYRPDGTVKRRYGIVDLGTLNWTRNEEAFRGCFATSIIRSNYGLTGNAMCSKYVTVFSAESFAASDKVIYAKNNGANMFIRDSAFTDAPTFKASLSGIYLVYEIATTTETAKPYQSTQLVYPGGTEEYVLTSIVPVGHTTRYLDNLRAKIEGLPWDFSSIIAPTEKTATASRNYTTGDLLIMGDVLYEVTANIASGSAITVNSNVFATTLSEAMCNISQSISVTVTGTDPVIQANSNTRYICGEVATLSFTPCASGICEVIFTSGTTPTVLTLPQTVTLPERFEVEASHTYEISIVDGVYGAVMYW